MGWWGWEPALGTCSSHQIASSSLNSRGGALFHYRLIHHGLMISIGDLPVSHEKQRRKSGWVGEKLEERRDGKLWW